MGGKERKGGQGGANVNVKREVAAEGTSSYPNHRAFKLQSLPKCCALAPSAPPGHQRPRNGPASQALFMRDSSLPILSPFKSLSTISEISSPILLPLRWGTGVLKVQDLQRFADSEGMGQRCSADVAN